MIDKNLFQKGNILNFKDQEGKIFFRSYICNLINEELLDSLGILTKTKEILLWKQITPFIPFITSHISPYKKQHTAIVLIHGIDFTNIYFPDANIRYINLFAKHRIDEIHDILYSYIPDSRIYHFYYPSPITSVKSNGRHLINELEKIVTRDNIKQIYIIGYSLGGLVAKAMFLYNSPVLALVKAVYTIDTPHLGTPLLSLLLSPQNQPTPIISTIISMLYRIGLIFVPAYIELAWHEDNMFIKNVAETTISQLQRLNYPINIFTIGAERKPKGENIASILKIIGDKHIQDIPLGTLTHISGFLLDHIGKQLHKEKFLYHDGVVPLISQQPNIPQHISLHTFYSNHIDITSRKELWHLIGQHIKKGGSKISHL